MGFLAQGGWNMPRQLNQRRTLLAAVEAFLEDTPTSLAKAHRLVQRLQKARQWTTLDTLVWGGFISQLTDSLFYKDPDYLTRLRATLLNGSSEIHRAYLNHDCRTEFTPIKRDWYERLRRLGEFLQAAPLADASAAIEDYQRQVSAIESLLVQTPAPQDIGQEQLYHFILREVTAALTTIDLRHALLNVGWMIPEGPYSVFPPDRAIREFDQLPDASEQIAWARRALRALAGEGWLAITWQVTSKHYLVSLHF
jgi:hypothetical protein